MKRIVTILCFLLSLISYASGQWRKLRDFPNPAGFSQGITYIYFIDLPGPPRTGFVGTTWGGLWRTSDGGSRWENVTPPPPSGGYIDFPTGIYFKDSLVGWFCYQGGPSGVYRTRDGGKTWSLLPQTLRNANVAGLYYSATKKRLLWNVEYPGPPWGDSMLVSTDLGDTWFGSVMAAWNFSFSNDTVGIASYSFPVDTFYTSHWWRHSIIYTFDGGITWQHSRDTFPGPTRMGTALGLIQPLAIPDTNICFATTSDEIYVLRSDDYGKTWRKLYDFGPTVDSLGIKILAPYGNGIIHGDLSRLYIGSDSGMLVSTDQGVSWFRDGGPPDVYGGYSNGFYANKGITLSGWWAFGSDTPSGLWEEAWPQSGVAAAASVSASGVSAFPNPTPGLVTISGAAADDRSSVVVTNVLGERVVGTGIREPGSGDVELDLSKLPAGTYFARVETASGLVMRKIIKQ